MKKRRQKTMKEYAETDFLSERKRDLNEIAEENVIYEESQTGPQEEPTLREVDLTINYIKHKQKSGKRGY